MTSERVWVLRLITALGGLSAAGLLPSGCANDSTECEDKPKETACFTLAELGSSDVAADRSDAGSAGASGADNEPLTSCPSTSDILSYRVAGEPMGYGSGVDQLTEKDGSCCYRHYYLCEGRPLVVNAVPVLAATTERADWSAEIDVASSSIEHLSAEERAALAAAWARDGAFEHASVASFAHFLVELLALGAPYELVREAERAMRDELDHARLCFALASRYAGKLLGPGTLAVPACAPRSLREVLLSTLEEGCISETIAAHAARQRLAVATDPLVVAALTRIVEDEQRHAELAFRFLRWGLEREPGLLLEARQAFRRAAVAPDEGPEAVGVSSALLRRHGILTPAARFKSSQRALRDVLTPCLSALDRLSVS